VTITRGAVKALPTFVVRCTAGKRLVTMAASESRIAPQVVGLTPFVRRRAFEYVGSPRRGVGVHFDSPGRPTGPTVPRARYGPIIFGGRDITQMPTHLIARLGISQSPEGRRIFPRMTVLENLQMGATLCDPKYFDEDLGRARADRLPSGRRRSPCGDRDRRGQHWGVGGLKGGGTQDVVDLLLAGSGIREDLFERERDRARTEA